MKLSRETLRDLGLEDSQVEQIMSAHGQAVQELQNKLSESKESLDSAKSEVKLYKDRVEEQSSQLDELKNKVNSGENLNEQIEALKQANRDKDKEHQKAMNKLKLNYEIDKELSRTGAKNNIAVLALIDSDELYLDDDGRLQGLQKQIEPLKESDSYLFDDPGNTKGEAPNSNNSNNSNPNPADDYNAGTGKGNNGTPQNEEARGRAEAERLLGSK